MSNERLIEAINLRIDEHYELLIERLRTLDEAIQTLRATMEERLDAHEEYHRRNEHRFGAMRLAERNPIRLALIAFVLGGLFLAAVPNSFHWFWSLGGSLMRVFFGI